ncbi:SusC/RagA family TonB-linked outer membrane protein [Odoribacter laneus]|uniref:SusC/RagA family TonB-linked outer membrane protein n=1 Tax=Odoribacter laneus TaxID=626933 RepID=UPI003AF8FBC0
MSIKAIGFVGIGLFLSFFCALGKESSPFFSTDRKEKDSLFVGKGTLPVRLQGIVTNRKGEALPGATVLEKKTGRGTSTDIYGRFELDVAMGNEVVVSFIGYASQVFVCTDSSVLQIVLEEESLLLEDILVTALGIRKKETSLVYAATEIKGDEIVRVKDPNLIVALMGKIAGMQIHKSSSGPGGSAQVLLRGSRSAAGNNQPLYVIDGVPMLNSGGEQPYTAIGGVADGGNRDGGDGISNLNPEDIKSISILKGAPAAALYGTQAANGVILITTKKGQAGKQEVTFSSHFLFEKAISLPKFQNAYGVSDGIESWGERTVAKAYDHAGDFFRRGYTAIHTFTISGGNEKQQTYFSYANTSSKGIVPHNRLSRHNFNLRETAEFYQGRLKLDGNISLIRQMVKNRPVPGGFYMNPLVGLYRFPRGMDMTEYREHFEVFNPDRNLMEQNWHSSTEDFEQNPYWVTHRVLSKDQRNRVMASLALQLKFTDWLRLEARGNVDYLSDKFREKFYASTAPALAGINGRYIDSEYQQTLFYGDVLMKGERKWKLFSLQFAVGASMNDNTVNALRYDSKTASLKYPNVFTVANINMNSSAYIEEKKEAQRQMQSVFGTFQLGYRDLVYLDVTARNDWSSTLAYTTHEKSGFFYPSVGMSWILSRTIKMPAWVSLGKIRAVWSQVGNDIPLYITCPTASISAGGEVQMPDAAPFEDMKPEMNTSFETGTEWKFWENRLNLSFTWYISHTHNQFFKLPAKTGDTYAYRYVNAGNVRNKGIELSLEAWLVNKSAFSWKTGINYAMNRNKVLRLHEELPVFIYGPYGFSSSYALKLVKGGSFGDIYGKAFLRDENGEILYETAGEKAGLPKIYGEGNTVKVGNANPRYTWSWQNTWSWKGLSLYMLIDSRVGGKVLSQTQADMDLFGVTKATAEDRDRGYVELEGRKITRVKEFYKLVVGGRAGVTEYYIYDATNVRLRELSLTYALPERWMQKTGIFQNVHFSVMARNLFFIYKKAPFDPDLVLSTGNDNQAIDSYGMPTTRSIGFYVRCTF